MLILAPQTEAADAKLAISGPLRSNFGAPGTCNPAIPSAKASQLCLDKSNLTEG